jgi:KDO2-lipid IV(A) lauroyltransferase
MLSLLPLRVLYVISDIFAFIIGKAIGYRRKVVRHNLANSFPDASVKELRKIESEFYSYLCDYFVETVKMTSMSEKEIKRRMTFEGLDDADATLRNGGHCSLYLGHFCNWEWISSLPLHFTKSAQCGQIYHPLRSTATDRLFLKIRGRYGATSIKMYDTLKVLRKWNSEHRASVTGYIADQVPNLRSIHHWTEFMHQDTPVYIGAERISRLLKAKAYYIDITRYKRGYYHARFVKISDNVADEAEFAVTNKYFALLEQSITANPGLWLWSHRRWKHNRESYQRWLATQPTLKR